MAVEVVKRNLKGFLGEANLVKRGDDYYVVSSVRLPLTGFETLVSPADAEGEVTDWGDVAGGRGFSQAEAIADLELNY